MTGNAAFGNHLVYTYRFIFNDGREKEFVVNIDAGTMSVIRAHSEDHPEWARLSNFRCPHCPMKNLPDEDFCPVAVSLQEIIRFFSDSVSFEKVYLVIETGERKYSKNTSLQDGVSAIIGVLMVTSGCPVMGKLKPMARFHIPFATLDETEYRVLSMYLLAQYFRWKKGLTPDWEMEDLKRIYDDIKILNQNVVRKIADVEAMDTSINAVVVLNNFADYVTVSLDNEMLDEIEVLFRDYLRF